MKRFVELQAGRRRSAINPPNAAQSIANVVPESGADVLTALPVTRKLESVKDNNENAPPEEE